MDRTRVTITHRVRAIIKTRMSKWKSNKIIIVEAMPISQITDIKSKTLLKTDRDRLNKISYKNSSEKSPTPLYRNNWLQFQTQDIVIFLQTIWWIQIWQHYNHKIPRLSKICSMLDPWDLSGILLTWGSMIFQRFRYVIHNCLDLWVSIMCIQWRGRTTLENSKWSGDTKNSTSWEKSSRIDSLDSTSLLCLPKRKL